MKGGGGHWGMHCTGTEFMGEQKNKKTLMDVMVLLPVQKEMQKEMTLRHRAFARGPPPYYYQGLLMLNVNDLMGIGAFIRV